MKYLKIVCVTFIALLCSGTVWAEELQDVIYLKNGSVLRGVVIEQIPNESLRIRTADGNVFALEMSQIYKLTKEEPFYKEQDVIKTLFKPSDFYRAKGYRGWVETGGAIALGDYGDAVFSFSTTHGLQVNPFFFFGLGVGIDYHFDYKTVFMPFYLDLRTYFINRRISPFLDAKIGYSPIDGTGLYFTPSLGVSFGVANKCALNLSVGYNMQRTEMYTYYYSGSRYYSNELLHGLSFKLGVEF